MTTFVFGNTSHEVAHYTLRQLAKPSYNWLKKEIGKVHREAAEKLLCEWKGTYVQIERAYALKEAKEAELSKGLFTFFA